jgi:hypothetical protein
MGVLAAYDSFSELLRLAVGGNADAVNEILKLYMPLVNRNSVIDGVFDEDCRQYILLRVTTAIPKFRGLPYRE